MLQPFMYSAGNERTLWWYRPISTKLWYHYLLTLSLVSDGAWFHLRGLKSKWFSRTSLVRSFELRRSFITNPDSKRSRSLPRNESGSWNGGYLPGRRMFTARGTRLCGASANLLPAKANGVLGPSPVDPQEFLESQSWPTTDTMGKSSLGVFDFGIILFAGKFETITLDNLSPNKNSPCSKCRCRHGKHSPKSSSCRCLYTDPPVPMITFEDGTDSWRVLAFSSRAGQFPSNQMRESSTRTLSRFTNGLSPFWANYKETFVALLFQETVSDCMWN